ncbi:hypothetical protein VOLCADRAFT_108314 [Volvox carteri f. nagariensis]|uniref:Radical SAM core domain-containing protein n=1 Tax=Volvox carteri f. nagariensis TaxID=3068 RepID=D8UJE5_VOLCA|nr:uncharacterized protein VOLCADRAFT_108314 [Volvox carteri f. nagariensis]EFJ40175.1 hypothetical protein VOLCADRAFT_108314 [Volvox carteri f. nagariensis]|eukprot:XP_002958785.1 hypothetical protein VOLCADRAFT_108314 [Volvox carteri f. nagariensis]
MVFASEAAVVIKGRDGRTVLLQSRGMDFQVASLAAGEAIAALQAAAQGSEPLDILSNTQAMPLLSGRVGVMRHNLAVTYRVAGGLVVLLVTAPTTNVFSCVELLNSAVRVVAAGPADGKAADLTPERLQRRFGQVYLAVDALLSSGGVLEANAALGRAISTLEQLHDKGGKTTTPDAPKTPPQQKQQRSGRLTRRTLQGVIDQLAMLSFDAQSAMQGVHPRPGFQLPDATATTTTMMTAGPTRAAAPAAAGLDPVAPQGAGKGPAASLELDDDFFGLGGKKKDEAARPKLPPVVTAGEKKEAATAAAAKKDAAGFEDNAFGDAAFTAPVAAAAASAPAVAVPAPLVPSEPVLRLAEVWRGEAAGGRLVRAGLSGRVEWVSEAAKSKVHTVQFMLQVPEASGAQLAAALTTARRHPDCCKPGLAGGTLVADGIQAKKHRGSPVLCYHLPPVATQPPVQVQLGASLQAMQDGRHLVTLGLHYAVSPRVAKRTADVLWSHVCAVVLLPTRTHADFMSIIVYVVVEVSVPALLEHPLRASPPGAVFDAKARVLRWQHAGPVTCLDNSGTGTQPFVASFVVGEAVADETALTAALTRLSARMSLRGADGSGTLSGAALAQGVVEMELTPALSGHLIRHPESSWHDVPDMPKAALALLDKYFTKFTTRVLKCQTSSDSTTTKLLVELQDGMQVEAVVMTYDSPSRDPQLMGSNGPEADPHLPVDHRQQPGEEEQEEEEDKQRKGEQTGPCGEQQPQEMKVVMVWAGLPVAALGAGEWVGTMGLKGNLNAGEIVEQLMHARAVTPIRNIVFMGMGEPLNNYEAVRSAVAMMTDSRFFGLRRRHVTVSTVGVVPRIKQLAQDLPGVSLALSLHAPTQELRAKIVPSARAYKLPVLMDAGDDVVINLIPWNPIYQPEGPFFNAPAEGSVAAFQGVLRHTYGLHTTIRQEMGQDISGACGQLVIESGGAGGGGGGGNGGCSREAGGTRDIEDAVRKAGLRPVA